MGANHKKFEDKIEKLAGIVLMLSRMLMAIAALQRDPDQDHTKVDASAAKKEKTVARGWMKGQMTIVVDKIQAHAAYTDISVVSAAHAKSMASIRSGLDSCYWLTGTNSLSCTLLHCTEHLLLSTGHWFHKAT